MAKSKSEEPLVYDAPTARAVLRDCRTALAELRRDPDGHQWRILWVATLALLRAVSDAIDRVDKHSPGVHPALRAELAKFWKRMKDTEPEPVIYWQFIREDANNLLHDYKFSARMNTIVRVGTAHEVDYAGGVGPAKPKKEVDNAGGVGPAEPKKEDSRSGSQSWREYDMKSGPFAGQDQRDVVQRAIEWWEEQIDEMIERAKVSR